MPDARCPPPDAVPSEAGPCAQRAAPLRTAAVVFALGCGLLLSGAAALGCGTSAA